MNFKATGTTISEVSYSENGGPTITERKTTKYSSDPSDFAKETEVNVKGNKSVERKSSKSGIYSVTTTENFESDKQTKPSQKIVRNGSVKELKEKFVRKSSSSKVVETKRSSVERDSEMSSVSKHSKVSNETKSFLNNEKKASNVKEVITYMRNADNGEIN